MSTFHETKSQSHKSVESPIPLQMLSLQTHKNNTLILKFIDHIIASLQEINSFPIKD